VIGFGWGIAGAHAAAADPDGALVVVDVLSFSTAVAVATGRGTAVYPHPWPSAEAGAFASTRGAVLAVHRNEVSERHPWSLSPAHLADAPTVERLVLPSPNGSAIAAAASDGCVLAGCLRNASATARWLERAGYGTPQRPVTVIAAGERWPDGELRPALEDLLGAAAIIAAFGNGALRSAEASATEALWQARHDQAGALLRECFSGQELAQRGFADDVALAAEYDVQDNAAVLTDGAFRAAR
jgi:2-phosphosulfolactate phosphatase